MNEYQIRKLERIKEISSLKEEWQLKIIKDHEKFSNRKHYITWIKPWIEHIKDVLNNIKESLGCKLCRKTENLLFHHTNPAEKSFNLGHYHSLKRSLKEMEKCIVLCSSCHTKIHYWYRRIFNER